VKEYNVDRIKSNALNLVVYRPEHISTLYKSPLKIYMNRKNGYWICLGPEGQKAMDMLKNKQGMYVSDLMFAMYGNGSDQHSKEKDMFYHMLKLCLDKFILMIQTGQDYAWAPQPMMIKDINLFEVTWAVAGYCNLRCRHCYAATNLHQKITYDEELENHILDSILSFCTDVTITGGEPFSHPRILTFIEKLAASIRAVTILTNGTLIDETAADIISRYDNIKVQISLDSGIAENHEKIRGRGTFDRTVKAIELLRQRKVNVVLSMVPMEINMDDMESLIQLGERFGIKNLHFPLYQEFGNGFENRKELSPNKKKICNFFDRAMEQMEAGRMKNGHNFLMKKTLDGPPGTLVTNCGVGRGALIDFKGNVYPCSGLFDDTFIAGNVKEQDVRDIYLNNTLFQTLRKIKTTAIEECSNCIFQVYCSGGCRSRALYGNGDIMAIDPYCNLYKHELETYLWKQVEKKKYNFHNMTAIKEVMDIKCHA